MKIAHMTVVTPRRCGLYETTRELVANLRALGVDSRLVDPTRAGNALHPLGDEDRGAAFGDLDWAVNADLISNHSGYDSTPVDKTSQPVVHVAHGRPKSSFISEAKGSTPIYSYWLKMNQEPRVKSIVTFWAEHVPYLQVMFPDKNVRYVQSSVDLAAWTPNGPSGYKFGGKRGKFNVVLADAFRDDIDPFEPLHAAALWAREVEGVRVHLYAKPAKSRGWDAIIKRLHVDGNLGEVQGWLGGGLDHVYRAASFLLTPQTIDTRSVREAMACGCPVVRMPDLVGWRERILNGLALDRAGVRVLAEIKFDPKETARQFKAVLEDALRVRQLRAA